MVIWMQLASVSVSYILCEIQYLGLTFVVEFDDLLKAFDLLRFLHDSSHINLCIRSNLVRTRYMYE